MVQIMLKLCWSVQCLHCFGTFMVEHFVLLYYHGVLGHHILKIECSILPEIKMNLYMSLILPIKIHVYKT